jgi:hypothetical protein
VPNKNIYIRDSDLSKWEALPNKAAFVHAALNRKDMGGRRPLDYRVLKNKKYKKRKKPEPVLQTCEIHGTTVNICRRFHV